MDTLGSAPVKEGGVARNVIKEFEKGWSGHAAPPLPLVRKRHVIVGQRLRGVASPERAASQHGSRSSRSL